MWTLVGGPWRRFHYGMERYEPRESSSIHMPHFRSLDRGLGSIDLEVRACQVTLMPSKGADPVEDHVFIPVEAVTDVHPQRPRIAPAARIRTKWRSRLNHTSPSRGRRPWPHWGLPMCQIAPRRLDGADGRGHPDDEPGAARQEQGEWELTSPPRARRPTLSSTIHATFTRRDGRATWETSTLRRSLRVWPVRCPRVWPGRSPRPSLSIHQVGPPGGHGGGWRSVREGFRAGAHHGEAGGSRAGLCGFGAHRAKAKRDWRAGNHRGRAGPRCGRRARRW